MKSIAELAEKASVPWIKKSYELILRAQPTTDGGVHDSSAPREAAHSTDDIKALKEIQYEAVCSARTFDGQKFQRLEDFHTELNRHFVKDGFWNPMSGVGSVDDPGMYSFAYTPVSMSPQEATAFYSSGGLMKVIVDKKSKGILLNGYNFEGEGWQPGDLKKLHDHAELLEFGEAMTNAVRDGLIYGGAIIYPRLKKDDTRTLGMTVGELLTSGVLTKDSIDHFVATDRWNCVLVPNWNVTARDYIKPSHYYIPIGGVQVATERSAIVRPNMLPYWGMLPQMGWGISDFEGYSAPVMAYNIVVMSIPIMAQQMSLLFHSIPLDVTMMMGGADKDSPLAQLIAQNQAAMRAWSILHPQAVNSVGEIKAIERHYEGFKDLVMVLRQDIGSRSEMPESVLFHTSAQGLGADNEEDVIQKVGVTVKSQFKPVARMIAIDCFGPEYFTGANANLLDTISVTFDSPTIQTPSEMAEAGSKFAEVVNKLVQSDIPVDAAIDMARQFFPGITIDDAIMARLRQIPGGPPDGYGGAAELGGIMAQGGLIDKLLTPGAYAGMAPVNGNGSAHLYDAAHVEDRALDDMSTKLKAGVSTLGERIANVESSVRDLAARPAPKMPEPQPITITVPVEVQVPDRPPMKTVTTYSGERDAAGNILLDKLVTTKTEVPVEAQEKKK
jgi:hypothetical protein